MMALEKSHQRVVVHTAAHLEWDNYLDLLVASAPTLVADLVPFGSLHTSSSRLGILQDNHRLETGESGSVHLLESTLSEGPLADRNRYGPCQGLDNLHCLPVSSLGNRTNTHSPGR